MRLGCVVAVLLLITGCDVVFSLDADQCPAQFDVRGYAVLPELASWPAAEQSCRDLQEEGSSYFTHLAVVTSEDEFATIRRRTTADVWIGLVWLGTDTDNRTKEDWVWITQEVGDMPWESDQPNNSPAPQNCGELTATGISDRECAQPRPALCECDGYPIDVDRL